MARRKRSSISSQPARPAPERRRLLLTSCSLLALGGVAVLLLSGGVLPGLARRMASRQMEAGAFSQAERCLDWADWFDRDSGRTQLMRATCLRRQGRFQGWSRAIQSAEQKGAPTPLVQQESRLGQIQSGTPHEDVEQEWAALIEAGASPHDVAASFIYRYLRQEEPDKAKVVLDGWAANYPDDGRVAYMAGMYWQWKCDPQRAETEFKTALNRLPRHELARQTLAQMLEDQHRLQEALTQSVQLAMHFAVPGPAQLRLARVLRKLGRLDEAQAELATLVSQPEFSIALAVEMGQIELERGDYQQAQRQFELAGLDQSAVRETLIAAACAFGLGGDSPRADQVLARLDTVVKQSVGAYDRSNEGVSGETPSAGNVGASSVSSAIPSQNAAQLADSTSANAQPRNEAERLYSLHCNTCHGPSGDGRGRAARHLFPRPRDLRTGKTRLVRTLNGVPTLEDIESGLKRGLPGTAMRPFKELSHEEQKLLAQQVQRLNREGVQEQLLNAMRSEEEEIDPDEVRETVESCTVPGKPAPIPRLGPANPQAIARGKDTYLKLGCDNCHGENGSTPSDTPLFDEKGRPSFPRDLAYEPFKGGQEPESVYLRIFLGMPGTPHPSCANVAEEELIDLVQYCCSLSQEPKWALTNHQRAVRAMTRASLVRSNTPASP